MNFNFGLSTESSVRNTRRPLAPWNIYDVKFTGCEVKEFKGKNDTNATYKVIAINFENEDGYFSTSVFFPKEGDDKRPEYENSNGGKQVYPSPFENCMAIVAQTGEILNPEGFKKMQAASSKFKSFDDVANCLIKITDQVKGKETKLKLVGRNRDGRVVADIPKIVRINSEGIKYISDNYIGDKLYFSDYEATERNKYLNAKPTEVKDTMNIDTPESSNDDFDIDSLL